jgi:prepilin-type processing-associated H-X9-DG protein
LDADFAVAAAMNPWMQSGDFVSTPNEKQYRQIITASDPSTWKFGNSFNHPEKFQTIFRRGRTIKGTAAGQNVLFADGHTMYLDQPNCGVNADNIYTRWSTDNNPTAQDIQGGTAPTGRDAENDAQSKDDSFLVI